MQRLLRFERQVDPGILKGVSEVEQAACVNENLIDMTIPNKHEKKRVLIAGAGFAGLELAKRLSPRQFEVILIDRNNYHQFQPLLYQVATSGLEPGSISFPLRKIFQKKAHVFIRLAELTGIDFDSKAVHTSAGDFSYDYLVLAMGVEPNYFHNTRLQQHAYSMKSVSDALLLRNKLLSSFEAAVNAKEDAEKEALLNVVIVGGGPTGVELAGAIAEMKRGPLPRDYPELNFERMEITLLEAGPILLSGMTESSGNSAKKYLEELSVKVETGKMVKDYDGLNIQLSNGQPIRSRCLIWAAGVKGRMIPGLTSDDIGNNNRIQVNEVNELIRHPDVFAMGDIAEMRTPSYSSGHPQVAQVAIQQASHLAGNLLRISTGKAPLPFNYLNKGSMATVGRNRALAEFGKIKFRGFLAWIAWMMIHLMALIGVKNRLFVLINWVWQYFTYDQSLRLIIRPAGAKEASGH